jgi:RimJ/RimL family protein N-acetyltransferase
MPPIPLPSPPLTDGEIVLRPWSPDDVPAVTAACQDPEIPRWTVVPHNYTERHARDFISGTAADLATGRELALAVVDADDQVLGALGISNFDWADLKAEIGYWMAREARGRGIGARATRLLAVWAIRSLGLERLELLANPANEASQRLAERAGFTREGTLRRYRRRHGVREDLMMFSLLAEDLK